jgi:hypothetical protein
MAILPRCAVLLLAAVRRRSSRLLALGGRSDLANDPTGGRRWFIAILSH